MLQTPLTVDTEVVCDTSAGLAPRRSESMSIIHRGGHEKYSQTQTTPVHWFDSAD